MTPTPQQIQRIYLSLSFLNILAASFIWGVNTLFLLSAGLTNFEAFAANAFYTLGTILFEVLTGIYADIWGRRKSYILGTVSLALSTLLYLYAWHIKAPFWVWAGVSILLGLGFTFFNGATDAWLVDALKFTGFKGNLDDVFAKNQIVTGAGMLVGSVSGGLIAQVSNLGVPYIFRAGVLAINCLIAVLFMHDLGFTPKTGGRIMENVKKTFNASLTFGLKNRSVRWIMLAGPFTAGVGIYVFYAMQPYLLSLWSDPHAYWVAGLAAAIVAGAQIIGGIAVPTVRRLFKRRTDVLIAGAVISSIVLAGIGFIPNFWIVIALLIVWGLVFAATTPVRQAYLNERIPGEERATVLSFDSLLGSCGGVIIQPILGRAADIWNYPASYVISGAFQIIALPFLLLARRKEQKPDTI